MASLEQQLKKAKQLNPKKLSSELFSVIRKIDKDLIELNTKNQLYQGFNAEGKRLVNQKTKRTVYSPLTEEISGGRKKAGDPYNFYDTGDFFGGFYIKVSKDKAVFGSKDSKTPLLIEEYGEIFGLTDKNLRQTIQNKILPIFLKYLKTNLGI